MNNLVDPEYFSYLFIEKLLECSNVIGNLL
jgi:hypothetical protein